MKTDTLVGKVGRLVDSLSDLLDWEYDFVLSVADKEDDSEFTAKQAEKVEEIYDRVHR